MIIRVKLFGRFRSCLHPPELQLEVDPGIDIHRLRKVIEEKLHSSPQGSDHGLVFDSVLATEKEVLSDEACLLESCELALLPPVCGG